MSRAGGAQERLRLALALVLAGPVAFLAMSLLVTTSTPSVALLAAAAAATLVAVVGTGGPLVTPVVARSALPLRRAADAAALRSGRATDSPRHPLRPRAPGLV